MLANQDVNASLIWAVREGRLEKVREVINSFGLSYSPAWSEGYVLLRSAVENGHSAVAKLLLTSGSKVNSKSNNPSNTPLHFAATRGDIEVVEMLLDRGANIDARNQYDRTPLHDAIESKKVEVTELLLRHRADVNTRDNRGRSPLHVAVERGFLEIVEHLLIYGACVDATDYDGRSLLHVAAERGFLQIVECLLKYGADVNYCIYTSKWNKGYTPLHLAVENDNKIAELLLSSGANVDGKGEDGRTPLHIATKRGHETVVRLLLQHGAKVDNQNKDGKTILHLAVEKGHLMIIEDVLKYFPDINNQCNRSSLKIAVNGYGEKYKKIVEALIEYGFIVYAEDANDPTLLHAAVEKGCLKIVEDLLKYGADVNVLHNATSGNNFTPLHNAAKNKQEEVAKLLISYGADVNAGDKTGKTPIFYAIEDTDLKITQHLLTYRANVKDNPELLNIAVKKNSIEIIEALLQYGSDINASDQYGRTALHFTALSESRFCTNEDPNISIRGKMAKLLLSKGADVDAQTGKGLTTLHAAAQKGYVKVVEALLENNANVNSVGESHSTPLHLSAEIGSEEIITMLLNKGADVNVKGKDGITALHIAAQRGHREVVTVLLECGAKVDSKIIKTNITPLHLGAGKGCQVIVKTILKFGADINSRDEHGRTALYIASEKGRVEVVETLLEYASDINITSKYNSTPLDRALAITKSFYRDRENYYSDDDSYAFEIKGGDCSHEVIAEDLKRHIVKMKIANLYISEKNLLSVRSSYEMREFEDECGEEIARMRSEKINNTNISFCDILTEDTRSLAMYMRNENIVQVLKSDHYKTKFPIYTTMIKHNFRKGMERRELLEQANKSFHFVFNDFPELPDDCTEEIFSFLSDQDLRNLVDACKPLSITSPNTH